VSIASLSFTVQADIVAQTHIVYHEKELLQLIHDHLIKEGKSCGDCNIWPRNCETDFAHY